MKLADFLQHISQAKVLPQSKIFAFVAQKEYPLLFTQVCIQLLKRVCDIHVSVIDLTVSTFDQVEATLLMSFLGMQKYYWISGLHGLEVKKKKKWITFFQQYSGPHVLFISQIDDLSMALFVDLSGQFYLHQAVDILVLLSGVEQPKINYFLSFLYKQVPTVTIEQLCLLVHYVQVTGRDTSFFDVLLPQIIGTKSSLFQLSQHLFSKNPSNFFALWKKISNQYNPSFWTSFWSEQFWSALLYVDYMHKKDSIHAKAISGRLPFSFLNQDWRLCSVAELKNAHNAMYTIDVELKNGIAHESHLDVFYTNFLYSNFK